MSNLKQITSFCKGINITYTKVGESYFHPIEPDTVGGGACLGINWNYSVAPACCGYWTDRACTMTTGGYFCQIKLPG